MAGRLKRLIFYRNFIVKNAATRFKKILSLIISSPTSKLIPFFDPQHRIDDVHLQ